MNDIHEKDTKCIEAVPDCQLVVSVESDKLPRQSRLLEDLLSNERPDELHFKQVPFDTPFVIMFSSGTTGTPKGIVHRQGVSPAILSGAPIRADMGITGPDDQWNQRASHP